MLAKFGTLRRVVAEGGVGRVASVMQQRAAELVLPPVDYARAAISALRSLARHGRPSLLINAIGAGIGDDLLCTAVFHELRQRGERNFWVRTESPALYEHNDDVSVLVPYLARYEQVMRRLGVRVAVPWYTDYNPAYDRDDPTPEQHVIAVICQNVGISGPIALRPYLTLTAGEVERGRRVPRQVAIQSSGLGARHTMRNKNWSADRYQSVVSALRGTYDFVQVGSPADPPLEGVLDLRGRTTIRETAAVLRGSLAFVGQVGMLMHLARAVDCRSVVVYGGRETPAQSGYPCNENLYSPVPCSPCWRLNTCPYDRECLRLIGVDQVVAALERQVARYGAPLEVDTEVVTPDQIERNARRRARAVAVHQFAWSLLFPTRAAGPDTAGAAALRVHDTLRGRGTVYDGERSVGNVDYLLKDVEETTELAGGDRDRSATAMGRRNIFGTLESGTVGLLDGYVGARLALELHDERRLPFTVAKVGGPRVTVVQGLGPIV